MSKSRWYLIWSNEHEGWWGSSEVGYVENHKIAGRYTHGQAKMICDRANIGSPMNEPNEVCIPEWAVAADVHAPSCACVDCVIADAIPGY